MFTITEAIGIVGVVVFFVIVLDVAIARACARSHRDQQDDEHRDGIPL